MKFVNTEVVLREIPTEISLAFNISGCPFRCPGCHSIELREDIGYELTFDVIEKEINNHPGVSCILLMGGDSDRYYIYDIAKHFNDRYKIAWYSGSDDQTILEEAKDYLNYIKLGSWQKDKGPLNSKTTNQRLYKVINGELINITNKLQ